MRTFICTKPFKVHTRPNNYMIPKGEICNFEGMLMGKALTLSVNSKHYPPTSEHLSRRCFTIFDSWLSGIHFKEIFNET